MYVGGIAGVNTNVGIIKGSYVPVNKIATSESEGDPWYGNETVLYQKEGINTYVNLDGSLLTSEESALGLAVGQNYGTIENIASDGVIAGNYNVGGLIGIQYGLLQNSFSSSQVIGNYNVGGLIGLASTITLGEDTLTARVYNNAVEVYDRKNSYQEADILIQGISNVGGLIGLAENLQQFEYNYIHSYVLRTLGDNYSGDIVMNYKDELQNFVMGGLIGSLQNSTVSLSKNYAYVVLSTIAPNTNLNMPNIYVGGLLGELINETTIENSYSKGQISLPLVSVNFSGNSFAGSVVGLAQDNITINYVYSTVVIISENSGDMIG